MRSTIHAICLILLFSLGSVSPSFGAVNMERGGAVATASIGGTFYVWGAAWTQLVNEKMKNYNLAVEVTGGGLHNIRLLEQNEAQFAFLIMPILEEGYNGLYWAKDKKYQNGRVLFPMYASFATVWAPQKTGIKNFRDLTGRIVNLAPKGGAPDTYYRRMFELLGIKPGKIVNSGLSDMVGEMNDGIIEAGVGTGGNPFGPALETESTQPINILDFNREDLDKLAEEMPGWFVGMRPAGGYKNFPEAKPALQFWNMCVTHKDLPDDIAYQLTKMFFENIEYFKDVYRPTLETKPEDILRVKTTPIHPGAARYYKEIGLDIPADRIAK